MRTKYLVLLIVALLIGGTQVFAQKAKADRLFTSFNYTKAIPYYEKLASKNNRHAAFAMQRLGDCHRLSGNFEESARWYSNASVIDTTNADLFFNYAQSLRSIGKYEEAAEQFLKYAALKPDDPRGELFARYSREVIKWSEPEFEYELINAETINTNYADFSPVYGKDGIIFTSDRMARSGEKRYGWTGAYYLDLFYSPLKKEEGKDFSSPGSPSLYSAGLSQAFHDGPATFSSDFSTVYFTRVTRKIGEIDSSRYYTNKLKIYSSKYLEENKWSDPEPFFLNSDSYSVGHPALTADGKTLYFVSDMPGGQGGTDIYKVNKTDEGWGPAENLGSVINTFGNEMFPYIHKDKVLYFSSDGHPGLGSLDVFMAGISGSEYAKPENMKAPVNSPADDFGIVINDNDKEGMISSNRPGGKGEDDIYMISIKERLPDSVLISGLVKDRESLEVLRNSTVFAWNLQTSEIVVLKTDDKGYYEIWAKPGSSFTMKGMKNGFSPDCLSLAIDPKTKATSMENRDLLLGKYKVDQIFRLENIYYDFDKWNIRADASVELDKVVAFLNENPDIIVELGSHTDSRGSFKYNERLSERRAQSAVDYIVLNGISNKRITAKGYGEYQLVNSCSDGVKCSDEEHQDNRRTEVKITGVIESEDAKAEQPLDVFKKGQKLGISDFKDDFFNICADSQKPL
jgi:outer membrane protein OmpA-like peptidoglycan-associated protein/tetratricopeptide (TPR) repeat protein